MLPYLIRLVVVITLSAGARAAELTPHLSQLPLHTYSVADGLPSTRVTAIAQDRDGLIWVGSDDGLSRFDSVRFEAFQPDAYPVLSVTELYIDSTNQLWVLTDSSGVFVLSADRQTWQRFAADAAAPFQLPPAVVMSVTEVAGDIVLGLYQGGLLQLKDGQVTRPGLATTAQINLNRITPMSLFVDGDTFLVGTLDSGLLDVDLVAGVVTQLSTEKAITGIAAQNGQRIALAGRIGLLDARSGAVLRTDLASLGQTSVALSARNDGLWVGLHDGLLHYSQPDAPPNWYQATAPGSLPSGRVVGLLRDREHGLWMAIQGAGLSYLAPPGAPLQSLLGRLGRRVVSATRDLDGTILVATRDSGLLSFDPQTQQETLVTPNFPKPAFRALVSAQALWLGDAAGLARRDGDGMWLRLAEEPVRPVDLLVEMADGDVFASSYGGSLRRFSAAGALRYRLVLGDDLAALDINDLLIDPQQNLWIAANNGLCLMVGGVPPCSAIAGLDGRRVRGLAWDATNSRVLALENGAIHEIQPDNLALTTLRPEAIRDVAAYGIAVAPDGARWVSVSRGLLRLATDGQISWLGTVDGLLSHTLSDRPFYRDAQGLLIGSERGVIAHDFAAGFRQAAQVQASWQIGPLQWQRDGMPEVLTALPSVIPNNAANLSFQIALRSYVAPALTRYSVRINGPTGAREWQSEHPLRFTESLAPGTHRISISGTNPYAVSPPDLSWTVTVQPPWHQTSAFMALLALASGLLALGAVLWYRQRAKARHHLLFIKQTAELNERLAASKSEFLATVSHELRNQLNGIAASADVLRLRGKLGVNQSPVERIVQSAEHMTQLLNDVLDLAKLERGTLAITVVPSDICKAFAEHVASIEARAANRGLGCTAHFSGDGPIRALDLLRFAQIMQNLSGNAVKFAREQISLRLSLDDENVVFSVHDDGHGIPGDQQEKLFTRFQQVHLDHAGEGAGLGLAISRELAQAMGGSITVQSQPAEGTTFTLILPAPIVEPTGAAELEQATLAGEIVLYSDDAELLEQLTLLHAQFGVRLQPCAVVSAAMVAVLSGCSMLMIDRESDHAKNLEDWLRDLTLASGKPTLLAISSRVLLADQASAIETGYDAVLAKPVTANELAGALRAAAPRM